MAETDADDSYNHALVLLETAEDVLSVPRGTPAERAKILAITGVGWAVLALVDKMDDVVDQFKS